MDEISAYVKRNLDQLMTEAERRANTSFLLRQKVEALKGTSVAEHLGTKYSSDLSPADLEVKELIEKGYDGFIDAVKERVLREDKDKHYLNYCPQCHALTRTPKARQCPKCFFSWHEPA